MAKRKSITKDEKEKLLARIKTRVQVRYLSGRECEVLERLEKDGLAKSYNVVRLGLCAVAVSEGEGSTGEE